MPQRVRMAFLSHPERGCIWTMIGNSGVSTFDRGSTAATTLVTGSNRHRATDDRNGAIASSCVDCSEKVRRLLGEIGTRQVKIVLGFETEM
jgi:hypothetical protein